MVRSIAAPVQQRQLHNWARCDASRTICGRFKASSDGAAGPDRLRFALLPDRKALPRRVIRS